MPLFTVEDGTGLANATSYVDEAYADDYLGATWASDSSAKQAALIAATEYADLRWGSKLKGIPLTEDQALELPRSYLYDRYGCLIEGIPNDWKKAVCLYAKEFVAGTLYPVGNTGTSKEIKSKETVVGPIKTKVEYVGITTATAFIKFPLADNFAKKYTTAGKGGTIRN